MRTLADLLAWLREAPPGTLLPARELASIVEGVAEAAPTAALSADASPALTWRERLWVVPPETRLGRAELLEALGRPRSWLYRATSARSPHRIPHRKLGGELVFLAGEVRAWLATAEDVVQSTRSAPLVITRGRRAP